MGLLHGKESGCRADPLAATRMGSSQRPLCPRLYSSEGKRLKAELFFSTSSFFSFKAKRKRTFSLSFLVRRLSFQPSLSAHTH